MTVGEEVYDFLKGLPIETLQSIVHSVHPDAKVIKVKCRATMCGEREEWHVVSECKCTFYAPVSLVGEREAWLNAVQRICKRKWPMLVKEMIQEGV